MNSGHPDNTHKTIKSTLLARRAGSLNTVLLAMLFAAALTASGCVVHSHGRGHGHHGGGVVIQPRPAVTVSPAPVTFVFSDNHRHTVRNYYSRRVPPGHRKHKWKKNRGRGRGGPPHWVHKGGHMPPGIAMQAIPRDLAVQLPPPPQGAQFIFYSDHVLLVDVHTHAVLDTISVSVGF